MKIEVSSLSFSYGMGKVLDSISFSAQDGQAIAVLGPNGVGKTTFFRCLLGFLKPSEGSVIVDGRNVNDYTRRELAHKLAYIPQSYSPAFNHTVLDSVLMGTTASMGLFQSPGKPQIDRAMAALDSLGIGKLAHRPSLKISGGERQLMLIARALVQDARILIMDEPAANLDFGNSFHVSSRIRNLANKGYTVIFSTHDPGQAYRYANRVVCMQGGRIIGDGKADEVLDEAMLNSLYGVKTAVRSIEVNGRSYKVCLPI
ncbi:MAG: ABC transporter ATP-binding protein [Sphaerochaetaceae bacterium]|jgi:iron complex transport system ATP-binding protein